MLVDSSNWRHIPTNYNPADFLTRESESQNWRSNPLWWEGPPIVLKEAQQDLEQIEVSEEELTPRQQVSCHVVDNQSPSYALIDMSRFSKYSRMVNCIAYVHRFIATTRRLRPTSEFLSVGEIHKAEGALTLLCQQESFTAEVSALKSASGVSPQSQLHSLDPYLDEEGLLRSKGRLGESSLLTYDERHPIILPDHHRFTQLIIQNVHVSLLHAGASTVVTQLRKRYWILKARRTTKSTLHQCMVCRRYKAQSHVEKFAPLPPDRCNDNFRVPFAATGMDYFGPVVSHSDKQKCYVLLFTCLSIRAVHLELTLSLDVSEFLKAFERFTSRRGCPRLLRSDNARTFHCASGILAKKFSITWKFSTEKAPWTGGCWERMVRSVKTSLKFAIVRGKVHYHDLTTYLCKVEAIVNMRPITYHGVFDRDVQPLSPADFLIQFTARQSDKEADDSLVTREKLLKELINNSRHVQYFWKRWKQDYLRALLTNRAKPGGRPPNVDDVVLLNDGNKRQFWPLCKVLELLPGRDGRIRTARILCNGRTYNRATRLLYNLEIND